MEIDVRTPCPALWEDHPHLTPLADDAGGLIEGHYRLLHRCNRGPWQFIHGTAFPAGVRRAAA